MIVDTKVLVTKSNQNLDTYGGYEPKEKLLTFLSNKINNVTCNTQHTWSLLTKISYNLTVNMLITVQHMLFYFL